MAIYLYTGNGAGKTTAALGLALRSLGHNRTVIIIQFMKGRKDIGEYKFKHKNYSIYQFGSKNFINLKKPSLEDRFLANKGMDFILSAVKKKPKLLILDEINLAVASKLIDLNYALHILKKIPKSVDIVLTGRRAPRALIKLADYVNEMKMVKMPRRMTAKKGIQY